MGRQNKKQKGIQWRASHILVRDQALVDTIYDELKNGTPFKELAKKYSACPSKKRGGDLGWFGPGAMVFQFENAVKKLKIGWVSKPVRTEFGTHIIVKTGKR